MKGTLNNLLFPLCNAWQSKVQTNQSYSGKIIHVCFVFFAHSCCFVVVFLTHAYCVCNILLVQFHCVVVFENNSLSADVSLLQAKSLTLHFLKILLCISLKFYFVFLFTFYFAHIVVVSKKNSLSADFLSAPQPLQAKSFTSHFSNFNFAFSKYNFVFSKVQLIAFLEVQHYIS